jgi:putative transposase
MVFIPKRRKKRIFGVLRRHLGEIFHELAGHKESQVVEGHLMADHVHSVLPISLRDTGLHRRLRCAPNP